MIKKVFIVAIISGIISGIFLGTVQKIQTVPLILEAEQYEGGKLISYDQNKIQVKEHHEEHDESSNVWGPENGFERTAFTYGADIILAIGFSFVLISLYIYISNVSIKTGLIASIIGYSSFFLIPSLGLSPEIPGMVAAPLYLRQIWWISTVLLSLIALSVLFFNSNIKYKLISILAIFVPFIIGAPLPSFEAGTAPQELLEKFVESAYITNGLFWLVLGMISSVLYKKQFKEQETKENYAY